MPRPPSQRRQRLPAGLRLLRRRCQRCRLIDGLRQADLNVQRVDIPYENSSMPGWFFRPTQAPAGAPTIVLVNGSDGSLAAQWGSTGAATLDRGYNVLLFDGPGQQSQLFDRD